MELQYEETKDKDGKPFSCTAWTTKDGRRVDGMTVDMQMAKDEGWIAKNGSKWKTMPQLMLRYRAASFFSRLNCPEVAMGLYTKEEAEDNDFEENTSESLQEQMEKDISENANSQVFEEPNEQNTTIYIIMHSLCYIPSGYQQNKLVAFAGSMSCLSQDRTVQHRTIQYNTQHHISCCLQVLPEHLKLSLEMRHEPQKIAHDRIIQDRIVHNTTQKVSILYVA
jgi:hypothetical protein